MAFYTYILQCADGSYYTGHTDNIEKRLAGHHDNELPNYVARRRPFQLVLVEESSTRIEAIARERQIKGWSRKKKEALISHDWDQLIALS